MGGSRLEEHLDRGVLRRIAGGRSFSRGQDYAAAGLVRGLRERDSMLVATVRGGADYRVNLGVLGEGVAYDCDCPVGEGGAMCKHVVAVGLTWLDRDRPRPPSEGELRQHLLDRTKDELVDLIMERAADDEWLHARLVLDAAGSGSGTSAAALAAAFDLAIDPGGFVSYNEAYEYFGIVDRAIDQIADLLEDDPGAVIELAEHAIAALEGIQEWVDDSDGGLGNALSRLADLHLAACAAGAPDPEALAERLARAELTGELDTFHGAAEHYAEILGSRGLGRYRRRVESEWAQLPPLGPGERSSFDSRRYRVTAMMESLARSEDDVDGLVAVMAHDLSLPYHHLRIAEVLQDAGRDDEALEWAERGLAEFPDRHDDRLSDFVADAFQREGRHDDALAITWDDYAARPVLERYLRLRERAEAAGAGAAWTERARTHLRERIIEQRAEGGGATYRWMRPPDASELVRILLHDGEPDLAWAEALGGGCSEDLWLRMAELREVDHPEDAIAVYRRGVAPAVATTNKRGYQEAVALLARMRPLMHRTGRRAEFGREVAALREEHRRKRNLLGLIDGLGWDEVPDPAR